MQVGSAKRPSRYSRGVKQLDPALVNGIHAILEQNPGISNAELARRLSKSRQTILYYRRALRAELANLAARNDQAKERLVMSQLDLVDRVTEAADDVRREISRFKSRDPDPVIATVKFRGHGTLNQIHRLLGEILGEVSPATTNIYLTRMEAFVAADTVDPATLPPHVRARLGAGQ
jgi:DNA-binding Lrp family transcriptional regulator